MNRTNVDLKLYYQKKYEQLIDEAADEISNFVEKAKSENVSQ